MNKNAFAKILFAAVAIVSALVGLNGRAAAQLHPPAQCCSPSQMPLVTSANGWTVKAPTCCGGYTLTMPASEITALRAGWHAALGQSHWIGNTSLAGTNHQYAGDYTYTYRFCLCSLPAGLQAGAGAMSLSVVADDSFVVYLNGNPFMQHASPAFTTSTTGTAPASAFVSGWNTLRIIVTNDGAWTGLDASGWIAGYFGTTCPRAAPIDNPTSTQRRRGTPPPQH